jgi:hypothetical protein
MGVRFAQPRQLGKLLIATIAAAFLVGTAVAIAAWRHDTRMDDADAAIEKAEVLVQAADCATQGKNQRDCERYLGKALSHMNDARQALAAAMAAADGGS